MTDAQLPDPAYHAGRKAYVRPSDQSQVPDFKTDRGRCGNASFAQVTCTRCGEVFYLQPGSSWFTHHGETRPCVFCFKVSRVP